MVKVRLTVPLVAPVPKMGVGELFALLQQRMSLGGAQFLLTARQAHGIRDHARDLGP